MAEPPTNVRPTTLNSNPLNPVPEVAPQLKPLHLSGILGSLDARSRQAISAKLAYTDFLAMLIGDEIARRESRKFVIVRRAPFSATSRVRRQPGA